MVNYIIVKKEIKKMFLFLVLLFVSVCAFSEEHKTGKMLIMGWAFSEEDTSLQTNIAIDAILNYAEAAKFQMSWDENDSANLLGQVELYKNIFEYEIYFEGVGIYINTKSKDDILDRYIEIDFCVYKNNLTLEYKLVLNFNNYKWSEDSDEKGLWNLVMQNEAAYDFFISWIKNQRR